MPHLVSPSATPTVVPSGGSKSFGQMKADVAMHYGMDDDLLGLVGRTINGVIDELNMKQVWIFNLVQSSPITTVSGTDSYDLESDFWKMYNTRKTDSIDYTLNTLREYDLDNIFLSQTSITGYPYVVVIRNTFRDTTVRLFPSPDSGHTIYIRYFKLIGKPSSEAEALDLPEPFQIVLEYGALSRMGAFNHQLDLARYWQALYDKAYSEMSRSDEDMGDDVLRFTNIEEIGSRTSYLSPGVRPRAYDFF